MDTEIDPSNLGGILKYLAFVWLSLAFKAFLLLWVIYDTLRKLLTITGGPKHSSITDLSVHYTDLDFGTTICDQCKT